MKHQMKRYPPLDTDSVNEDPDSFEEISPGKRQTLHKVRRVERDTPNTSTESLDPHRNSRINLATPCSRRPASCEPDLDMHGVVWTTNTITNSCQLDRFLTMLICLTQKVFFYPDLPHIFSYKLEDNFHFEPCLDRSVKEKNRTDKITLF